MPRPVAKDLLHWLLLHQAGTSVAATSFFSPRLLIGGVSDLPYRGSTGSLRPFTAGTREVRFCGGFLLSAFCFG